MDLVWGGAVGDAVAVVLVEGGSLAGAAVFSDSFAEFLGHCRWHLKCELFLSSGRRAGDGSGLVCRTGIIRRCEGCIITRKMGDLGGIFANIGL